MPGSSYEVIASKRRKALGVPPQEVTVLPVAENGPQFQIDGGEVVWKIQV
jgi:hypothetical protein